MEARVAVEVLVLHFAATIHPGLLKNRTISTCGCKLPPSGYGRRDFTLAPRQMLRCCLHMFDGQIARLSLFEKLELPQQPAILLQGVLDTHYN